MQNLENELYEEIDLVDENDNVVGFIQRKDLLSNQLFNYRVVNALIVNKLNKIFIPIRSSLKQSFPNALDFSVGGHVKRGETYLEAMKRECIEEVNIDLNEIRIKELFYLSPYQENISSFMKIWIIFYDHEINYCK